MGKTKKKFIDKNESQHFHLLHRSQRDEAYAKEDRPSNFVLVPASSNYNNESKGNLLKNVFNQKETFDDSDLKIKDHINSLGFKNDGYDYEQHLKTMESGKFMSKTGQFIDRLPTQPVNLPDDVLASEFELDRNFQAITLNPEFMDDDIRAGLFEDGDEEGDFEELDDDFVLQIASEPEVPDFDFDAHMAKLFELSEKSIKGDNIHGGKNIARGWEHKDNLKGHFLKRKPNKITNKYDSQHGFQEGFTEEDEDDEDEEYESHDSDDEDGDSSNNEHQYDYCKNNKLDNDIDEEFEKILEEYGDDQIGYIEEDEDCDDDEENNNITSVPASIDINDVSNELLNKALDEFILEHKDIQLYEGCNLQDIEKMKKEIAIFRSHIEDNIEDINQTEGDDINTTLNKNNNPIATIDYKKEYSEQLIAQQEAADMFPEFTGSAEKIRKALTEFHEPDADKVFASQEYLRHEVARDEWDCETILSTYSTLDNHPTVIKDAKSKFKPYQSKHERRLQANLSDNKLTSDIVSSYSKMTVNTNTSQSALSMSLKKKHAQHKDMVSNNFINIRDIPSVTINDIHLSQIPITAVTTSISNISADDLNIHKKHLPTLDEQIHSECNKNDDDDKSEVVSVAADSDDDEQNNIDNNQNNTEDEEEESEDEDKQTTTGRSGGRANETKEEKRQRKQQIKEERRLNRQNKKKIKEAFKYEQMKFSKPFSSSNGEKLSVYKY